RGLLLASSNDAAIGQVINIAYGKMITIREVAQTIARVCRRPDLAPIFSDPRPGDVHSLQADTKRARDILGYRCNIAFEAGVESYLAWFARNHPSPSTLVEEAICNWQRPPANMTN